MEPTSAKRLKTYITGTEFLIQSRIMLLCLTPLQSAPIQAPNLSLLPFDTFLILQQKIRKTKMTTKMYTEKKIDIMVDIVIDGYSLLSQSIVFRFIKQLIATSQIDPIKSVIKLFQQRQSFSFYPKRLHRMIIKIGRIRSNMK